MSDAHNLFQYIVDGLSRSMNEQRAKTQLTLGALIRILEGLDENRLVLGLGGLESYRGYYCDLSFRPTSGTRSVGSLLDECRTAMGEVFEGYKGGEYVMGALTPLWVSYHGEASGQRLMRLDLEANPIIPVCKPEDEEAGDE